MLQPDSGVNTIGHSCLFSPQTWKIGWPDRTVFCSFILSSGQFDAMVGEDNADCDRCQGEGSRRVQ